MVSHVWFLSRVESRRSELSIHYSRWWACCEHWFFLKKGNERNVGGPSGRNGLRKMVGLCKDVSSEDNRSRGKRSSPKTATHCFPGINYSRWKSSSDAYKNARLRFVLLMEFLNIVWQLGETFHYSYLHQTISTLKYSIKCTHFLLIYIIFLASLSFSSSLIKLN